MHRDVGQADTYCDLTVEFTVRVHGMSMGPITTFVTIIVSQLFTEFIACRNFSIINLCKHSAISFAGLALGPQGCIRSHKRCVQMRIELPQRAPKFATYQFNEAALLDFCIQVLLVVLVVPLVSLFLVWVWRERRGEGRVPEGEEEERVGEKWYKKWVDRGRAVADGLWLKMKELGEGYRKTRQPLEPHLHKE